MRIEARSRTVRAVVAATACSVAILAAAATRSTAANAAEAACAPPISVCAGDAATAPALCPAGYRCTCVPSCPSCRDCATRVCVPGDERACRNACDCEPGLGCFDGKCIAGTAPVYCCDSDRCPAGEACQNRNGEDGVCKAPECSTACDCPSGLGCFEGRCIAGFVPVFCCEGDQCPAGDQCQHRDGRLDRCERDCVEQAWLCRDDPNLANRGCGDGRVCSCTASCPDCEDCGANVCVPPGQPTPYRCDENGGCAQPGDRCICVSSCPVCDDCAFNVCVPGCDDPMCEKRLRASTRRINRVVGKIRPCRDDADCVRIDTSTECQGTCGAWVNSMYAARVENFIDHLDERYCDGYRADGCPYATPRCRNEQGRCVAGLCTGVPVDAAGRASRVR